MFSTYRICTMPPLNPHADVTGGPTGLIFGIILPLLPDFEYARSECSGETAHAGSSEPSLLSDAISARISFAGPIMFFSLSLFLLLNPDTSPLEISVDRDQLESHYRRSQKNRTQFCLQSIHPLY